MTKQVHRIGDPDTGGGVVTGTPQTSVYANNKKIAVNGSSVSSHGLNVHIAPSTANGSTNVFINNIPVNRTGDPDTCGHTRAAGSPNVYVN